MPALTVNWGWWSGNGIATREQAELFSKVGMVAMQAEEALAALDYLLESGASQQVVAKVDWAVFKPVYESRRERPLFRHIQVQKATETQASQEVAANDSFLEELQFVSSEQQSELLQDFVRRLAAEILGFDTPKAISLNQGFFKMGMDSMMTVQLRTRLETSLNCSLPPTIAFEYPSIAQLVAYLQKDVIQRSERSATINKESESQAAEAAPELLDSLSEDELMNLLDSELARVDDLTKDGK